MRTLLQNRKPRQELTKSFSRAAAISVPFNNAFSSCVQKTGISAPFSGSDWRYPYQGECSLIASSYNTAKARGQPPSRFASSKILAIPVDLIERIHSLGILTTKIERFIMSLDSTLQKKSPAKYYSSLTYQLCPFSYSSWQRHQRNRSNP
ncbi:hypothetical protein BDF20DRAFT_17752 [Mycotypha africana]|uniref:uncharacterized protein n=1 Tax=Mycotypha africana TaxID=64632 RepID=UPI0023012D24|nr:uncharacterized protein BDF20DRAFT_17752 [Mycotypha africana]KAI8991030.1 hypothetical protein BDF20DRAFT_17752 [Mycotypha africana]